MTTTIPPKVIVFDINGVLLQTNRQAALHDYLSQKAQTDERINVAWQGDAEKLMFGLLYRNCPLCDFSVCRVAAANGYPHVKIALEAGQQTYEGLKVGITQMLTHHVHCPPGAQITLDYIAEFLSRPELLAARTAVIEQGQQLLDQAAQRVGAKNLFILSNMPTELYGIYRPRFADLFGMVPEKNVVLSSHTGIRKPSPEAFSQLATKFGVVPNKALFIDDKEKNVQASRDIGMYAMHFTLQGSEEMAAWYQQLGLEV